MSETRLSASTLLANFSLDMTWSDVGELDRVRVAVGPGSRVHVAFRDSDDLAARAGAARAARRNGFVPVPIIAARRLESEGMLRELLSALQSAQASGSVLVVGGDPAQPRGPYQDTVSVIGSGLLEACGVRQVSVAGYPGGHPVVADDVLWRTLAAKDTALEQRGLAGSVITQFEFDPNLVLSWLADLRLRGVSLPVAVGVPGPASSRRLLGYASRCGVTVSPDVAREYGLSLSDPGRPAEPDRFVRALASGYDRQLHGEVRLHFFTFGGLAATAEWVSHFLSRQ